MKVPSLRQVLAAVMLMGAVPGFAMGDVLMIDVIQQRPPNSADGLERPKRMMTKEQVEARFGAPEVRHDAVGDPPITRWDYPLYSVYFEYQWVLETVVRREGELTASSDSSANPGQ